MSAPQPNAVTQDIRDYKREARGAIETICRDIFANRADQIQVQSEAIAVRNLARIIQATLAIANRKGFTAMTLRELARRAGLSLGGLYAYIRGKDDLVAVIQHHGLRYVERTMSERLAHVQEPRKRLLAAIQAHLYLSEVLRPWFLFLYMEARHLGARERRQAIAMEQETEGMFADIIREGQRVGVFADVDAVVAAGLIKAMVQDWYLKHRKHVERGLDVSTYAEHVHAVIAAYLYKETAS